MGSLKAKYAAVFFPGYPATEKNKPCNSLSGNWKKKTKEIQSNLN